MRFKRLMHVCVTLLTLAILSPLGTSFAADTFATFAVTGLSSNLQRPTGVAIDGNGNVFLADTGNNKVLMFNASGALVLTIGNANGVAGFRPTLVGGTGIDTRVIDANIMLNAPGGVSVDSTGNLYIADSGNNRVHMVLIDTTTKVISTTSRIFTVAGNGLSAFSGDGTAANTASLSKPTGIAVDATGNILIADNGNNRIRKVAAPKIAAGGTITYGTITTIAGDGKPSTLTAFGIALSPAPAGDLYIADSGNNRILKMTAATGTAVTVAGTGTAGSSGAGGLATKAQLKQPSGVATDGKNLYVADTLNNCIRMISLSSGVLTTRAGISTPVGSLSTTGFPLYPAIDIDSVPLPLTSPMGLTVSSSGDVYVADTMTSNSAGTYGYIKIITPSISAVTTATPPGGIYSTPQTIFMVASPASGITYSYKEIVAATGASAAIPNANSGTYTGPIPLPVPASGNAIELQFFSTDIFGNTEKTNTALYVVDAVSPVTTATIYATPTIAPTNVAVPVNGIIYSDRTSLTVTLTVPAAKLGSSIYYTTTGIAPTPIAANLYTVPFTIPVTSVQATTNVQFFAVDLAGNREVTNSRQYTVVALTAAALPTGGIYRSTQSVILTANYPTSSVTTATPATFLNPVIYYTTDGTEPTAGAPTVTGAGTGGTAGTTAFSASTTTVPILVNTTLKFYAAYTDINGNVYRTQTQTQVYTIDMVAPNVTNAPSTLVAPFGLYNTPQTITLTSDDPTATIYYTTTGVGPTTASTKYTAPITVSANTTLMFFGIDLAGNRGAIQTAIYTIDTVAPITTASLLTGTYASVQSVRLTSNDPTATTYFTIDGTQPNTTSAKYTAPLTISKTTTLKYFGMDPAGNPEAVKTQTYTIITLTTTAAPMGGVFNATQTVELTTNSVGATIFYTLNPVTPAPNYNTYTAPILMSSASTTLMYYAVDAAGVTESVKTEIYTMDTAAPSTSPVCSTSTVLTNPGGTPTNTTYDAMKLSATDNIDPAPRIKYIANTPTNLDNTATVPTFIPAYTLTDYTKPITFDKNTIVKFFATDAAGNVEQIRTAYCPTTATVAAITSNGGVVPAVAAGAAQDTTPTLYLNTLADLSSTSDPALFITGNVQPVTLSTLTVTGSPVAFSSIDGSFSYQLSATAATPTLVAGANTVNVVATRPDNSSVSGDLPRSITSTYSSADAAAMLPQSTPTPTTVTVGTTISVTDPATSVVTVTSVSQVGVVGNVVRVPITFSSGYQAGAAGITIEYDPKSLSNPSVEITGAAAASGKTINGGIVPITPITTGDYGYRILIMNTPNTVGSALPIPDAVVAYLKFTVAYSATPGAVVSLPVNKFEATDLNGATMTTGPTTAGSISIVSKPGNSFTAPASGSASGTPGTDVPVTLGRVLEAVYMLLDPIKHPVDGSVDLNADGVVQINEVQRVINAYVGL